MRLKTVVIMVLAIISTLSFNFIFADEGTVRTTVSTTSIFWLGITEPGSIPEPPVIDEPGFETEGTADTPYASISLPPEPLSDVARREIRERTYAYMSVRYPPIMALTINLPDGATEADKVIIEAGLPYEDGVKPTYCVQLMALESDAPELSTESTVYNAQSHIDRHHVISATPDPDGIFRFNITKIVSLIRSHEISNRFILKPFALRDKFEIPSYTENPFRLIMITEE